MKGIFRGLVVSALILQIMSLFVPYTWGYLYEGDALNLLYWGGYGSYLEPSGPVAYAIVATYGVIAAGLFLFHRWARTAFVIFAAVNAVATPLWGIVVASPIGSSVGYVLTLADGAIIATAFLTSVSYEFDASAQQYAPADAENATRFPRG